MIKRRAGENRPYTIPKIKIPWVVSTKITIN